MTTVAAEDVYDNAVAAIYLTKRGRLDEAQKILEVFLRLMYPTDFKNIYPEAWRDKRHGQGAGT